MVQLSDKKTRQTLYAKCILTFALTYYIIFFVVVVAALFMLGSDVIFTNVLEMVGAAAVIAGLVLHLVGKEVGKVVFTIATLVVVVSQLVGGGLVLWANCALEVMLLLLVSLLRKRKIIK